MKRITAMLLAAMVLFSGCGGGKSMNMAASSSAAYDTGAPTSAVVVTPGEAGEDMAATEGAAPSIVSPSDKGRKIIYRVDMSLETLEFSASLDALGRAVDEAGGYIEQSSVSGNSIEGYSGRRNASIVARIPPDRLDAFLAQVAGLCNVVYTSQSKEDVTTAYTDVEIRKQSLEVEQQRLIALLEKADSIETIVALESRLSEVRYELESMASLLRSYDERIDYSTVSLELMEVVRMSDPAPTTMGERIRTGFSRTLYDIRTGAQDFAVWFIVDLPYLLALAVVAALVVLLVRRARKRRLLRKKVVQPPEAQEETKEDQTKQ